MRAAGREEDDFEVSRQPGCTHSAPAPGSAHNSQAVCCTAGVQVYPGIRRNRFVEELPFLGFQVAISVLQELSSGQ